MPVFFCIIFDVFNHNNMSQNTILQLSTAYMPPIEYMALLVNKGSKVIIEKEETYPKQTYRNRCKIMTANGVLNLTIPVEKVNGNITKTKDIKIINSNQWYINHWRAISSAYSGSPFFLYYKDDLKHFFKGNYDNLLKFNNELLNQLLNLIGIKCTIEFSNSFTKPDNSNQELDYRYSISPKISSDYSHTEEYYQVFSNKFNFTPNLSIIDLLFNIGPETKNYLETV